MRMKKRFWLKTAGIVLLLFVIVSIFFILSIKNQTYLGIRAEKEGNVWVIKKIQSGGAAQAQLQKGDIITQIDDKQPDEDAVLTKWLIVEGASEIHVFRDGEQLTLSFSGGNNILAEQFIFTLIGLICLSILFILPTLLYSSTTYRLFFLFVTTLSFSLISVIPSSIGNNLARVMIILVVTFLPLFYFKFSEFGRGYFYRIKRITNIINFICGINSLILILNLCGIRNYWFSEYLAIGVFYVFGLLLIALVLSNIFFTTDIAQKITLTQVNLPLITILSFVPFFCFYLFPPQRNAPFYLVILFLLLPLAAIIHLLLINRLIKHKGKADPTMLTTFMAIGAGSIVGLLIELGKYISTIYLVVFAAVLIYALLPLLSESLLVINKRRAGPQGIQTFIAAEEERENISAYVHDTIIQEVIFEMNRLEQKETIEKQEIKTVFDEVIYGLRELCTEIYPLMIQEVGVENTLKTTINSIQQKYPVVIELTIDPKIEQLSLRIKNFLLRTIRETITNSIKHGKATKIEITFLHSEKNFVLTVFDNGDFADHLETKENHFGIHLINEKVKMIGGLASLTKEINGTQFQLEMPSSFEKTNEVST
jgi:two-component system secretion system sensor histidine kinase SalK